MNTTARKAPAAAALAIAGVAAGAWIVTVQQMAAMDMGVQTELGSFTNFIAVWAVMMAAMMLPGVIPAVQRSAHLRHRAHAAVLFVGSYLIVWALVGVVVFALYRPHDTLTAAALTIAAGIYEFAPLKSDFRRRCNEAVESGLTFGLCCVGSNIGLMLVLIAVGMMSITWMCIISIVMLAQKLLPPRAARDTPVALATIGLGILILLAPMTIPGLN